MNYGRKIPDCYLVVVEAWDVSWFSLALEVASQLSIADRGKRSLDFGLEVDFHFDFAIYPSLRLTSYFHCWSYASSSVECPAHVLPKNESELLHWLWWWSLSWQMGTSHHSDDSFRSPRTRSPLHRPHHSSQSDHLSPWALEVEVVEALAVVALAEDHLPVWPGFCAERHFHLHKWFRVWLHWRCCQFCRWWFVSYLKLWAARGPIWRTEILELVFEGRSYILNRFRRVSHRQILQLQNPKGPSCFEHHPCKRRKHKISHENPSTILHLIVSYFPSWTQEWSTSMAVNDHKCPKLRVTCAAIQFKYAIWWVSWVILRVLATK